MSLRHIFLISLPIALVCACVGGRLLEEDGHVKDEPKVYHAEEAYRYAPKYSGEEYNHNGAEYGSKEEHGNYSGEHGGYGDQRKDGKGGQYRYEDSQNYENRKGEKYGRRDGEHEGQYGYVDGYNSGYLNGGNYCMKYRRQYGNEDDHNHGYVNGRNYGKMNREGEDYGHKSYDGSCYRQKGEGGYEQRKGNGYDRYGRCKEGGYANGCFRYGHGKMYGRKECSGYQGCNYEGKDNRYNIGGEKGYDMHDCKESGYEGYEEHDGNNNGYEGYRKHDGRENNGYEGYGKNNKKNNGYQGEYDHGNIGYGNEKLHEKST